MKVTLLPYETRIATGFTHKVNVTHADLTQTTAATAQVIPLLSVAVGDMVEQVATFVNTYFTDASDTAFNTTAITIGDDGSAARFLASQELNTNGTEVKTKAGTGTLYSYLAANTVDVTFNAMTAKALSDIDAGDIDIFLAVRTLAD